MSEKAFEYRIGQWLERPEYEETFMLRDDADLNKLNLQILMLLSEYVDLPLSTLTEALGDE